MTPGCTALLALLAHPGLALAHDPRLQGEGPSGPAEDAEAEADDAAGDDEEADWDVLATHGPHHEATISVSEGTWMSVDEHGGTLVFDLLGDIWTLPLTGGTATRLTSDAAWDSEPRWSPDGQTLAFVSDRDGNEQIWLMDADGSDLRRLTSESEARVTDPVWDPAGEQLVVRRRTVDTRSIGVTELWQVHLDGGKGTRLTSLDAHPHAGETTIGGRYLYFSSRNGRFNYDEDPVAGLWNVVRLDRWTGDLRPVVHGSGSAVRPTLSPDGRTLAFVSRDRAQTVLELLDLETGRRRVLADWLSHDQMEGFALHGVYPVIDWVDDQSLVLWAQGRLWRLGLDGERTQIPFQAQGTWTFHEVPRWKRALPEVIESRVVRWPVEHPSDGRIAFSAMGRLWEQAPGAAEAVPLSEGTGYAPAWSPDGRELAWTSWQDPTEADPGGGSLWISGGRKGPVRLPLSGELLNPAWSPDGQSLVVLRGVGGGPVVHPNRDPWWELVRLDRGKRGAWTVTVLREVDSTGANQRAPRMVWHEGRIWYPRGRHVEGRVPNDTELVSIDAADGTDLRVHMIFDGAVEVLPSPDFSRVAYKQDHQVHVTVLPPWPRELSAADGSLPSRTLTEVVGDWLSWGPDSRTLHWMEGNVRKSLRVDSLREPEEEGAGEGGAAGEEGAAGEGGVAGEESALPEPTESKLVARLPRAVPEGTLAITGATVLTMKGQQVVEDATIVVDGDRISSVVTRGEVPPGAQVVDAAGKVVIPGLVDVHAHMHYASGDVLPEEEWRYRVNLDFGVTTIHDPSASTDLVFTQAERVEAGLMSGPRITSTGFVLYGALSNQGAKTPDEEAAQAHIQRLAAVGAVSAKIYQQSRRDQRQWYVAACNEHEILCVAEGGGDLWMNLGMVADGFQAIEHALPVAPLHEDVRAWMAASHTASSAGTAYTPTLLVAYGGLSGEQFFFQEDHPFRDPELEARLLRHWPRRVLDGHLWRVGKQLQPGDFNHEEVARDAAALARDGVLVTLGAHGQLQGLGVHWELWALAGPGAMSPMEALRAGTIEGARYLGIDDLIGTVEPGKLADLVILDADPREDIRNSARIDTVIKNGQVVARPE